MPAPTPYWLVLYEDEGLSLAPSTRTSPAHSISPLVRISVPQEKVLQFFHFPSKSKSRIPRHVTQKHVTFDKSTFDQLGIRGWPTETHGHGAARTVFSLLDGIEEYHEAEISRSETISGTNATVYVEAMVLVIEA